MVYPNFNNFNGFNNGFNNGFGGYGSYGNYQQNPQSIQNINVQPQSFCYFVKSPNELNNINVMPNTFYLGINTEGNEIYVRRMNNDGLIDMKTFSLLSEKKEKTDLQTIAERLDGIEKKLSELPVQRQTLTLKGKENERSTRTTSE